MKCKEFYYKGKRLLAVLDDDDKMIPEVNRYLKSLIRSENTERSYASRLLLYYRFLKLIGIGVKDVWNDDKKQGIDYISDFIRWLQYPDSFNTKVVYNFSPGKPARANSTVNEIVCTVMKFYLDLFSVGENKQIDRLGNNSSFKKKYRGAMSEMAYSKMVKRMNIPVLDEPEKKLEYITESDYKKLCEAANTLRDKVLLGLMYEAGLRIGEALGLHICDFKYINEKKVYVVYRPNNVNGAISKDHNGRAVGIKPYLVRMIIDLLRQNEKYGSDYLFLTYEGKRKGLPMLKNTAQRDLKNIGIRAGLPDFHAHLCRHGYGMRVLNKEGKQLDFVAKTMGHEHTESTKIYAEYTDDYIAKVMSEKSDNKQILLPEVLKSTDEIGWSY